MVTTWGDRKALLRDEEREKRLAEYEQSHGDKAVGDAIDAVLAATGEPGSGYHEAELERILDRAGVDTPPANLHPLAYVDRHGVAHLPQEALAAVSKTFAAAKPDTVIGYLDDYEEPSRPPCQHHSSINDGEVGVFLAAVSAISRRPTGSRARALLVVLSGIPKPSAGSGPSWKHGSERRPSRAAIV